MAVLSSVNCYRILTTEQIRTLHFSQLSAHSEAPRVLLTRLLKANLLQKHLSYARSTAASDGLSITKPIPCWSMPNRCHNVLEKLLCSLGRSEEIEAFRSHYLGLNHANSFSDQSLAHEIGISQLLISFNRSARQESNIEMFRWLRSSPRHPLTAAKAAGGTINPDAIVFMRVRRNGKRYPYIFYLEYESGTNSPHQYSKKKIAPYAAYMNGQGNPPLKAVIAKLSDSLGLELHHPARLRLRVLTISKNEAQSLRLHRATGAEPHRAFLFSDLTRAQDNPYGRIWLRNDPVQSNAERHSIP